MVEGAGILNAYASRKWKNNGEKKMLSCCNDWQFLKLYSYFAGVPEENERFDGSRNQVIESKRR